MKGICSNLIGFESAEPPPKVGDDILGLFPILDCFYTFLPIVRGRFDVLEATNGVWWLINVTYIRVLQARSSPMNSAVAVSRRTSFTLRLGMPLSKIVTLGHSRSVNLN